VTVLLYHPLYSGRGFSPIQDSWQRYPRILALLDELGLQRDVHLVQPPLAGMDELRRLHPPAYLAWLQAEERAGGRRFDRSTPAWPGVFDRARASVGASVHGARLIGVGTSLTAFNPSGGLHHAHAARASGFCLLNDVVAAVRVLQWEFGMRRIAVVDIDGHHGDGTQALLYREPVLVISTHRYGGRFYPGTGCADERGDGPGLGYTVNVPLPRACGDDAFLLALHDVVEPALQSYRPECIILQYGTDGHFNDAMVRLGLTTYAYAHAARLLHHLAARLCGGRLLVVGGGGYRPEDAVRCWAFLLGELCDLPDTRLAHLHDQPPFVSPAVDAGAAVQSVIARLRAMPAAAGSR
jgi:acetoin utilization protein AcuC